jgi:hypothetical protein
MPRRTSTGAATHGRVTRGLIAALLLSGCGGDDGPAIENGIDLTGDTERPQPDTSVEDTADTATEDTSVEVDTAVDTGSPDTDDATADTDMQADTDDLDGSRDQPTGAPCTRSGDCIGGQCRFDPTFPDGFCSVAVCSADSPCAEGELCATYDDTPFCTVRCEADTECREGYRCINIEGPANRGCVPRPTIVPQPDGEACTSDEECLGGTCLLDPEYPSGFCTRLGCTDTSDCTTDGLDNECLRVPGSEAQCYRMCSTSASPCRPGYYCQNSAAGFLYCQPIPQAPQPPPLVPNPFNPTCIDGESGDQTIEFTVAPTTRSFVSTLYTTRGRVDASALTIPSGRSYSLDAAPWSKLAVGEYFFSSIVPIYVPQFPGAQELLEPGTYSLSFTTSSGKACVQLVESSQRGTRLDINVYFVGIGWVDATTAATDTNLREVFDEVDDIFGSAGVSLGTIRYFDVTGEAASYYRIVRSFGEVQRMVAQSTLPGPSVADAQSINVYFVQGFAFPDGVVIGISAGIPGAIGLHGTAASGVAFTTEYMRTTVNGRGGSISGNAYTGLVMAHEIGHYLGLFHIGEDDLGDTNSEPLNLMLPVAYGDNTRLTAQQSEVLASNPVMK